MAFTSEMIRSEPQPIPSAGPRLRRATLWVIALTLAGVSGWLFVAPPGGDPSTWASGLQGVVDGAAIEPAGLSGNDLDVSTTTVTQLNSDLVRAFQRARDDAAAAGEHLVITSGYRTPERQLELLDEAIAKYGSREEALWWVFEPSESMHVQGLAIDVGDGSAADWLQRNGSDYGLCRTLEWEWWHFEWRASWEHDRSCPRPARTPDEAPGING